MACQWFIEALEKARARFGFQIWAYVLMPDHVHLVIRKHRDIAELMIDNFQAASHDALIESRARPLVQS